MSKQIPWLRVFVEGVVIVGSILLAFGLQAWWEGKEEAKNERQQIAALADDFSQNIDLLTVRQARIDRSARLLTHLRDMLRASPDGSRITVPDSLLNELRYVGTIDPVRGTLDAMIGSGRLDQLSDSALRSALTDWQRLVSDVRTDQVVGLEYLARELIPFLATQGDLSHTLDLTATPSETTITVNSGWITMLAGKLLTDQWVSNDIAPLVERTQQVLDLLLAQGS